MKPSHPTRKDAKSTNRHTTTSSYGAQDTPPCPFWLIMPLRLARHCPQLSYRHITWYTGRQSLCPLHLPLGTKSRTMPLSSRIYFGFTQDL